MTHLPLPPWVLYAGLAGTALALVVATVQNQWSLRVFFLLTLRLAIGWQFLFEGLGKIHSHWVGPTETNKPFTSEPYFRDADGPLGPLVRRQIGDPEDLLRRKVEPAELPAALAAVDDPHYRRARGAAGIADEEFVRAVPSAVRAEWDHFTRVFAEQYRLTEEEQARLTGPLTTAALARYGRWVAGVDGRDSQIKYVSGEAALSAPQRLHYLRAREAELDDLLARRSTGLGNGYGYELARVQEQKRLIAAARAALIADADAFLRELKAGAFAAVRDARFDREAPPAARAFATDEPLASVLPPLAPPETPAFERLPEPLRQWWDRQAAAVTGFYPGSEALAPVVATAATRFANWYFDRDEFDGRPRPGFGPLARAYAEARQRTLNQPDTPPLAELAAARNALLAALDAKAAELRSLLTAALPPAVTQGPLDPPAETPAVQILDKVTMWFLTAVGAMLLLGLFTRLASVLAAGFLLATYLTHPPFPWLPLPPGTEGTPVFVNKNLIELLALLTVAAHPTGRWLGLDALCGCCARGRTRPCPVPPAAVPTSEPRSSPAPAPSHNI